MEAAIVENGQPWGNKIHPLKFALWVACASIIMLFGAFTSAYVVRMGAGNWLEFRLPDVKNKKLRHGYGREYVRQLFLSRQKGFSGRLLQSHLLQAL